MNSCVCQFGTLAKLTKYSTPAKRDKLAGPSATLSHSCSEAAFKSRACKSCPLGDRRAGKPISDEIKLELER